jgi:hypothetical protein
LERRDLGLSFELVGEEEQAAALLTQMVAAGFQVSSFVPEEIDLETVYRKASQKAEDP